MTEAPADFRYAVEAGIATITFDRPDRLNAFTRPMGRDLIGLLDRVDVDDAVRVVILTGAGRAFCAGADLTRPGAVFGGGAAEGAPDGSEEALRDFGGRIALRLFGCLKPVIAAINGPAAGMGVTMTLPADFRLAAETAKFSLPFARRGIVPESAASWFLPRIVGIARALDWTLTGRTFPAAEALSSGLVRSLHAPGDLLPAARALAREIADNTAPVSVALTRQMLWRMLGAAHPMEAHRLESRFVHARSRAPDTKEGVQSFLEKRPPNFTDRVSADLPDGFPWWQEPGWE